MKVLMRIVQIVGIVLVTLLLAAALYITIHVSKDTAQKADAIIILGARSTKDNNLNPCLIARVDHGVTLFRKQLAPVIIMSGGNDTSEPTNESTIMKALAINYGINPNSILTEGTSQSTYENILNSKKILNSIKAKSVIVVTEPYHNARSELVAKKYLSQTVYVSPASESVCRKNAPLMLRYFSREVLALVYYFVTGKI